MEDDSNIEADAAFPTVNLDRRRVNRAQLLAKVESQLFERELEPVRFGRYILEDPIGEGGFGIVYRGVDPMLRRSVAIKLLRSRRKVDGLGGPEALVREARMAAQLQHPHVVRVFDVGCVDSEAYGADVFVVMELLSGQPLGRWRRSAERDPRSVVELMIQIADGLAEAHRHQVVHCDVKPPNVLITDDGQAKVVDFGLALHSEQRRSLPGGESGDDGGELEPVVAGTPAYMAPEVHEGAPLVPSSDQYSFSIMLAEAIAGEYPFERGDPRALYRAKLRGFDPAWLRRHIPRRLIPIIERGASLAPMARYRDLDEMKAELLSWLRPSRALPWSVGVLAVFAGAGVAWGSATEPKPCSLDVDAATQAWTVAQPLLRDAWDQPERLWDGPVGSRLQARVDTFAQGWGDTAQQVCDAGPTERAASQCLLERLGRLDATLETLIDPGGFEHVDRLLTQLEPAGDCLDPQSAQVHLPVPRSASMFDEVASVRDELSRAHALFLAGRYDEGLSVANGGLEGAVRSGFEPAQAEALFEVGLHTAGQGRFEASVALIEQAYFSALGFRYERLAAATSVRMVAMHAVRLHNLEQARQWARRAQAAVRRLPEEHRLRAELAYNLGMVASLDEDWVTARSELKQSREGYERLGLDEEVSRCRVALGTIDNAEGNFARALERFESVVAFRTNTLGAAHPSTAYARSHAASALTRMGKFGRARTHLVAAIASLEQSLGPEHQHVASSVGNLAVIEMARGEWAQALTLLERTLELFRSGLPGDHPAIANALDNIATVRAHQQEYSEAHALDQQALEIRISRLPPAHPMLARSHAKVAGSLARLGRMEEAQRELQQAVEAIEQWPGEAAPGERLAVLEARVALGETPLAEFRALLEDYEPHDTDRWDVAFSLAKLLAPEQPAEARRLASAARDGFEAMGAAPKQTVVDSWLRAHRR